MGRQNERKGPLRCWHFRGLFCGLRRSYEVCGWILPAISEKRPIASYVNSNLRTPSTILLLSTKTSDIPLFSCCGNNKSLFGLVARSDPVCGNVL